MFILMIYLFAFRICLLIIITFAIYLQNIFGRRLYVKVLCKIHWIKAFLYSTYDQMKWFKYEYLRFLLSKLKQKLMDVHCRIEGLFDQQWSSFKRWLSDIQQYIPLTVRSGLNQPTDRIWRMIGRRDTIKKITR